MTDKAHRVKVQLGEEDLRALIAYARSKQHAGHDMRFQFLTWVLLLPMVPLVPAVFTETVRIHETGLTTVLLLCVGATTYWQNLQRQRRSYEAWIHSPEARWHLQPREVEIAPAFVRTKTALFEATYLWAIVSEIERFRDCSYFLIGHGQIIIVPDRSFRDAEARESFVAAATQYRSMSLEGEFTCPKCNYDLRGDASAGCPECGWGRKGEQSATTSEAT